MSTSPRQTAVNAAPDEEPLQGLAATLELSPDSGPLRPFEVWAAHEQHQQRLSPTSVRKYQPLWLAWTSWLDPVPWSAASAQDLARFLEGPPPGRKTTRAALNPTRMSPFTRERYFRLVRGVYLAAMKRGAVKENPALELPEHLRPALTRRDLQPQVLEPRVFQALRRRAGIEQAIPLQSEQAWWHVRDRALLAVLAGTGLTTAELIALRGSDVRAVGAPLNLHQPALDGRLPQLVIDVRGQGDQVGRELDLPEALAPLLLEWLRLRDAMLAKRAGMALPPPQRAAWLAQHDAGGPLFIARPKAPPQPKPAPGAAPARKVRRAAPAAEPQGMEPDGVYYTVSKAVAAARTAQAAEAGTSEGHVASGPAIIRNTVIQHWLATVGSTQTVTLAGFRDSRSLRSLQPGGGAAIS